MEGARSKLTKQPRAKKCYICQVRSRHPGPFCEACDVLNTAHREAKVDMTGRVCIVTGCRVKIGYEVALALLRMGATVVGTTRFPKDALGRFLAETDGEEIVTRLQLYEVDLLRLSTISDFTYRVLTDHPRIHAVINNAAQTIRRPPAFYAHLLPGEALPVTGAPLAPLALTAAGPADGSADCPRGGADPGADPGVDLVSHDFFPAGMLDEHGQQVDLRPENTWTQMMGSIDPVEVVECLAVNAAAPFILVQSLLPGLLAASGNRFVVNASAMEGKFYRPKTPFHPHTNMAKAALNQWTRTSGGQLAKSNIFMTAVDTGWVTDERPVRYQHDAPFEVPLDCKDGAMRLLHPIIEGYSGGELFHSIFLKDFRKTTW
jgi:NAD(P)-dependent dehydrogenase (short-subunit alcohol dehydrogenase family)